MEIAKIWPLSLASEILPREVWTHILFFTVYFEDSQGYRLVCKMWSEILDSDEWYSLIYNCHMFKLHFQANSTTMLVPVCANTIRRNRRICISPRNNYKKGQQQTKQ